MTADRMLSDGVYAAEAVTEYVRRYHAARGENPPEECKAAVQFGYAYAAMESNGLMADDAPVCEVRR